MNKISNELYHKQVHTGFSIAKNLSGAPQEMSHLSEVSGHWPLHNETVRGCLTACALCSSDPIFLFQLVAWE